MVKKRKQEIEPTKPDPEPEPEADDDVDDENDDDGSSDEGEKEAEEADEVVSSEEDEDGDDDDDDASSTQPSRAQTSTTNTADAPSIPTTSSSIPSLTSDGRYRNRQKLLLLSSRGITARYRHLLEDLKTLIPHHKKESKLDVGACKLMSVSDHLAKTLVA